MRPFAYSRPGTVPEAAELLGGAEVAAVPLYGGTTVLDLTRLGVLSPGRLVDLRSLRRDHSAITKLPDGSISIGGLATMAEAAGHPLLRREIPAIVEALELAASPQIRNMASIAGNLLQRTRCPYYRDVSWPRCNRRRPGTGCQAIAGLALSHAVLGVSDACVAAYPGDLAPVLAALGASAVVVGRNGTRTVSVEGLHRLPGDAPERENNLGGDELILAVRVPPSACLRRSAFVKLRNRAAYEFAEASAMIALDLREGIVHDARVALGGVATVPWRSRAAEAALIGGIPMQGAAGAADAAFAEARVRSDTAYKVEMGKRAVIAAIRKATEMEPVHV